MTAVLEAASWVVAVAAVGIGTATLAATRRLDAALPVLLDLLLAAGLLRLAATDTWAGVGTAAAIIVVRRVVGSGMQLHRSTRFGHPSP